MDMDEESERVAVELAAQGVIGKRVDEMETDFMTALDYMIQLCEKDKDDNVWFFFFQEIITCLDELRNPCVLFRQESFCLQLYFEANLQKNPL